jgi:outer membrane biosynthesis protein TonB
MTPDWKQWEGRKIDGRFTLQRCLHNGPYNGFPGAVFLTEHGGGPAAIRVVAVNLKSAEPLLNRWNQAARLAHPNLAKLREVGSCRSEGTEIAFVVTDYGEEILADVLKDRPLDATETRQVLEPLLGTLGYLHSNGYAHGRVSPANLMAVGDTMKLSSDSIARIGDPGSGASTAADVFGLGTTLVEALTQRQPDFQDGRYDEPLLPEMPAPFLEIARRCLHKDPLARWTIEQIALRLREGPQSGRPAKAPSGARFRLARVPLMLVGLAVLALAGVIVYSKWLKPSEAAPAATTVATETKPAAKAAEPPPPAVPERPLTRAEKRAQQRAEKAEKLAREREEKKAAALAAAEAQKQKAAAAPPNANAPTTPAPAAAAPVKPTPEVRTTEADASAGPPPPGVVKQVIPEVTPKARATINGKVKTSIRVSVDATGTISGASIDSPGSSLYFAGLALGAARKWQFAPSDGEGSREWILYFEFTRDSTRVNPVRAAK